MKRITLYPDVCPVKGFERSMLYDLGRNKAYPVPHSLLTFLESDIKETDSADEIETEYIEFLLGNELAFFADRYDQKQIKPIDFQWKSPYLIQTLEADVTQTALLQSILDLQKKWDIPFIQLVIKSNTVIDAVTELVCSLQKSSVVQLNLIFLCSLDNLDFLNTPYFQEKFVQQILIDRSNIALTDVQQAKKIHFVTETDYNERFAKIEDRFLCNITLFSENQHHHSYFNKRLFINHKGEMKNARESEQIIGSAFNEEDRSNLNLRIEQSPSSKIWNVAKSDCDVCRDCEFRGMCVDNRLPVQRSEGEWFHTSECHYNPYICKWSDEPGYQTLTASGITSNEKGFSIDHSLLQNVVSELWEEIVTE